jgi:hypothetical protein
MHSTPAVTLVMVLYLVPLCVVGLALVRPSFTRAALVLLSSLVLIGGIFQAGPFTGGISSDERQWISKRTVAEGNAGNCVPVLETSTKYRLILDRSDLARPVVAKALWSQLPERDRAVVEECLRDANSRGGGAADFQVVQR